MGDIGPSPARQSHFDDQSVTTRVGADLPVALGPATSRFVGRRHLLDTLGEDWAAVQGGASRITWLVGEAGIGKTALVRRFTDHLESTQLVWVSADEAERLLRFGVAERLLRAFGAGPTSPRRSTASGSTRPRPNGYVRTPQAIRSTRRCCYVS